MMPFSIKGVIKRSASITATCIYEDRLNPQAMLESYYFQPAYSKHCIQADYVPSLAGLKLTARWGIRSTQPPEVSHRRNHFDSIFFFL